MTEKKNKNICISQTNGKKYENRTAWFFSGCGAVIACAGFLLLLGQAFPSVKGYIFIAAGATAICSASLFTKNIGKYIAVAFPAISIAAALVMFSAARNGTLLLINDFLDFFSLKTRRIYLAFSIENTTYPAIPFLVIAAFSVLAMSTAATYKTVFPLIPVLIVAFIGCSSGFLGTDIYFALFLTGVLLLLTGIFMPENTTPAKTKFLAAIFAAIALSFSLAVLPSYFINDEGSLRSGISDAFHSVIYDSGTNSMPEGKLKNLGKFKRSDTPALEIKIEQPQKLYIKGFVGEVYDGERWSRLPNKTVLEYKDTFFWLHQNGFYPQSELANACSLSENTVLKNIEVKNLSACKKYAYVPYTLAESSILDPYLVGDSTVFSKGESYSAKYAAAGLSEFFKAQLELSSNQSGTKEISDYLTSESAYRSFVYEHYLGLTETAEAAISYHLKDESSALTFTEIIETVTEYLKNNIEYDENTITQNGDTDFIKYFLDCSNRGYSVHYATVATMMLRYFGIPARYVEGYFISASEAAEYGENTVITLDENHAHAWAEYYLDGVGWIPFEVTPGYIDDELENAAFSFSGESGKLYYQSDKPITNVIKKEKKDKLTELKNSFRFNPIYLTFVFTGALLALAVYIIIMRKKLRSKLAAIDAADNKNAVALQFGYAEMLRSHAKIPPDFLESIEYDKAFSLNEEALFSTHKMDEKQRAFVYEYSAKILDFCKEHWSFGQKLINRWIKCLYIK